MLRDRRVWLSITPEPERELPRAIATLRAGGDPSADAVRAERERAQRLVLRGSRRRWLAWLAEAERLAAAAPGHGSARAGGAGPAAAGERRRLTEARDVVLAVVGNHNALMRGLPGREMTIGPPEVRRARKESEPR